MSSATQSSSPGRNESGKPTFDDAHSRQERGGWQWEQYRQCMSSAGLGVPDPVQGSVSGWLRAEQWLLQSHGAGVTRSGTEPSSIHRTCCSGPYAVQFAPSCKNKTHSYCPIA